MNVFSPAMLKSFEQCPRKYFFRYVKNISVPQSESFFQKGKNIHALANYYLKGENIEKFERALNEEEKSVWNKLKSVEYFNKEIIASEYKLNFKLNNLWFGGRLDALVKQDNSYIILDYKTGVLPKNPQYDYQTMIYILAVSKYFLTDDVKFVYIDLKNGNDVVVELTSDLKIEYEKKLTDVGKKLVISENSQVFLKKTKDCKCEYDKICV